MPSKASGSSNLTGVLRLRDHPASRDGHSTQDDSFGVDFRPPAPRTVFPSTYTGIRCKPSNDCVNTNQLCSSSIYSKKKTRPPSSKCTFTPPPSKSEKQAADCSGFSRIG